MNWYEEQVAPALQKTLSPADVNVELVRHMACHMIGESRDCRFNFVSVLFTGYQNLIATKNSRNRLSANLTLWNGSSFLCSAISMLNTQKLWYQE